MSKQPMPKHPTTTTIGSARAACFYPNSPDAASAPPPEPEIPVATNALIARLEALLNTAGNLHERLGPVLSLASPEPGAGALAGVQRATPLGQQLDSAISLVNGVSGVLGDILNRLEL